LLKSLPQAFYLAQRIFDSQNLINFLADN
jgi:hypothetical protein